MNGMSIHICRLLWVYFMLETQLCSSIMKKLEDEKRALLGKRIRNFRKDMGWSQQELGNRADVNYKFIGEIERGQQSPTFDILVKIANAFSIDLPELFHFEPELTDRKEIENKISLILKKLPDDDLRKLLSIIRSLYPLSSGK